MLNELQQDKLHFMLEKLLNLTFHQIDIFQGQKNALTNWDIKKSQDQHQQIECTKKETQEIIKELLALGKMCCEDPISEPATVAQLAKSSDYAMTLWHAINRNQQHCKRLTADMHDILRQNKIMLERKFENFNTPT